MLFLGCESLYIVMLDKFESRTIRSKLKTSQDLITAVSGLPNVIGPLNMTFVGVVPVRTTFDVRLPVSYAPRTLRYFSRSTTEDAPFTTVFGPGVTL